MGFRGTTNRYMASYLSNRKQCIQVGNFKSCLLNITKGVPQGSILGPFLFCLYVNDIFQVIGGDIILFADDAAFFISAPSLQLLYARIRKLFVDLSNYLQSNKLIPNLIKSKLMYFSSRPCPATGLEVILFRGTEIEWVEEYRYLGLTITNKMSFALHIDSMSNKISQYIGVFYYLRKLLPLKVMFLLYNSLVLPHVTLHIELWGAAPEVYLNKLAIKQNKVLRAILGVEVLNGRPAVQTISMYRNFNVLTLRNVFKLQLFKLLISLLKGEMPMFYDLLLRPLVSSHSHSTRGGHFRHPLVSCEVERRAVANQLILCLDGLNIDIFIALSVKSATKNFKKVLLSEQ